MNIDWMRKGLVIRLIIFAAVIFGIRSLKDMILTILNADTALNIALPFDFLYKWNLYKAFVVILLVFILYNKEIIEKIPSPKFAKKPKIFFSLLSLVAIVLYYTLIRIIVILDLSSGMLYFTLFIIAHIVLLFFLIFLWLSIFGVEYTKSLWKKFRHQAFPCLIGFIITTAAFIWFTTLWPFFSTVVTIILFFMLVPFYFTRFWMDDSGPIIQVNDFTVSIGEPCSGIDSMLLFTFFYVAIMALHHKKIFKGRAVLFFIIGFLGVYAVNIIRLYLLLLVGVHISPRLAVGFFHTNAGWVLFVAYFLLYYWVVRRWIYR